MELDMAHSIEVLTVSTSSSPGHSMKNVVPIQVELTKYPVINRDEGNKLRRPVRPIDRQRMRPWLMELLDLGNVFGLRWTNRHQGIFQISWRHASRLGWNLETDGDVFERWARHTGIYKEGDPPEPKRWKANFRCALHSLHDVVELTNAVERRGRNACRTYRFLQSTDEQSVKKKKAKGRRAQDHSQVQPLKKMVSMVLESGSSEDVISDTESEASHQDKVIVQTIDIKPDISGEDFCLHHDHDYAGMDKTQKTIVLRQGVGSIMLHKEVQNAPDEAESLLLSNLDQLASAAMNSACIGSAQQGTSFDYGIGKTCMKKFESLLDMPGTLKFEEAGNQTPKVSLRHLLLERNVHGVHAVDKSTRKRKSLEMASDSFMVDYSETEAAVVHLSGNIKTSDCVCLQDRNCQSNNHQSSEELQLTHTTQRSGSPKILCRRSKRNKPRNDKSMSELSEPLMSSCLLLLEAATRLDIAEKTGVPSTSCKDKQNLKLVPKINRNTDIHSEVCLQNSDLKYENATRSCSKITSFEILRNTLENANIKTESEDDQQKPKAISCSLFKETGRPGDLNVESLSGSRIVATEEPFIMGLFSNCTEREENLMLNTKLLSTEGVEAKNETETNSEGSIETNQTASEECVSFAGIPETDSMNTIVHSHLDTWSSIEVSLPPSGHSPLFVPNGSNSLGSILQIETCDQECIVVTSETQDNNLIVTASQTSAGVTVNEQPLISSHNRIEQMQVINKDDIFSILGSKNASNRCLPNSENLCLKSLQVPVSSVAVSPNQRTVSTSCLPLISKTSGKAPSRLFHSQAEMLATTNVPVSLNLKDQDVATQDSKQIAPTKFVLTNCSQSFNEASLQTIHTKNVNICNPTNKINNEMAFHVLPHLSSSHSLMNLQPEVKKATAKIHIITKSNAVPVPMTAIEVNNTQNLQLSLTSLLPNVVQSQTSTDSLLPKPSDSASTREVISSERTKQNVPVIINRKIFSVDNVHQCTNIKPEILVEDALEDKDAVDDLTIKLTQDKNVMVSPSFNSSLISKQAVETSTHSSLITSNPCTDTQAISSSVSSQDHLSIVLTSDLTHLVQKQCTDNWKNQQGCLVEPIAVKSLAELVEPVAVKSLAELVEPIAVKSLAELVEPVAVKSLAELCKKHLAHLFSTLDNHTSESEENDSVTESSEFEVIDDVCLLSSHSQEITQAAAPFQ